VHLIATFRVGIDVGARAQLVDEQRRLGITWLCQVLGVDRKRFYRWRRDHREFERRAVADESPGALTTQIHDESGGMYGAVRVTVALRQEGSVVNRKRLAGITRERGIQGMTRRRRRSLTRPDGKAPLAPDLLRRRCAAREPGELLVGDITCVPTRDGWMYLAVLLDLCSSVAGVTGKMVAQRRRGIRPERAGSHSRSAQVYLTRSTWRRSAAFSWRRTSSSASLDASWRSGRSQTTTPCAASTSPQPTTRKRNR
jgi:hypothetical protein